MSRHAAAWTAGRRITDRLVGRTTPGKHHPLWAEGWVETRGGSLIHPARLDATARALVGAAA